MDTVPTNGTTPLVPQTLPHVHHTQVQPPGPAAGVNNRVLDNLPSSSSGGAGNAGSTSVDAGSIFDTLADIAVDHIARLVTLREGLVHQVTPDQLADMDEKFNAAVQRIRAEIPARNHTLWSDPNCPYPDLHDVESEGEQDDESEAMEEARGGADHHTGW